MPRVFVVQDQKHLNNRSGALESKFDLSTAERYGELIYLLSPTARPFSPEHLIGQLHEKLSSYTSGDYLVLIGNPALIGFTVAIASQYSGGRVRVLQWDGRKREYVEIQAELERPQLSDGLCHVKTFSEDKKGFECFLDKGHLGDHYPSRTARALARLKNDLKK